MLAAARLHLDRSIPGRSIPRAAVPAQPVRCAVGLQCMTESSSPSPADAPRSTPPARKPAGSRAASPMAATEKTNSEKAATGKPATGSSAAVKTAKTKTATPKGAATKPAARQMLGGIQIDIDPQDLVPETFIERLKREARSNLLGLATSITLHLLLLMALAMVVYNTSNGEGDGEGLIASWMTPEEMAKAAKAGERVPMKLDSVKPIPIAAITPSQVQQPPAAAKETGNEGVAKTGTAPKVERALTGRDEQNREKLMKLFGGTKATQGAVDRGLIWLTKVQLTDGRWQLHKGYADPSPLHLRDDTSATALAVLSFLGAGYTHQSRVKKYRENVEKGLSFLRRMQKGDGKINEHTDYGRNTAFYAQAQATIALLEAYAMTGDESLLEPAQRALQFIYDSQNTDGGWRYQPHAEKGDLSVTVWQIMALQTARMAGLTVPENVLSGASRFLDAVSAQNDSRYKYLPTDPPNLFTPTCTAEGLLCRQYLGWPREHPALQDGVSYLLQPENLPTWGQGRRDIYEMYYATQVMHHMEGPAWDRWNSSLRDVIASNQVKRGDLAGSWSPNPPNGAGFEDGDGGGRLYLTCMCIMTMEVYYRHLPLYHEDTPDSTSASAAN